MLVSEIMTADVLTVRETGTLVQALTTMSENGIRHLPVVDDAGTLVGIVSDTDLQQFHLSRVSDLETLDRLKTRLNQPIASDMSADVLSVGPEADITEAIDLMIEERIGALPVVDAEADRLVGIVSYIDVLRAARDLFGKE